MPTFHTLSFDEQLERLTAAALSALRHWDFHEPSISLLSYRENAVYKVVDARGYQYALRVHRANYHSERAVISELSWMHALKDSAVNVPDVKPNKQGQLVTMVQIEGEPRPRIVDVLVWVDGATLTEVLETTPVHKVAPLYHKIGELSASLHNQASVWQAPQGFSRHSWDLDGLLGEQPFWGRFWDFKLLSLAQRRLVLEARTLLLNNLQSYRRTAQNYSLIHADMIPENLMLNGDDLYLIDFDDAGFGYHLFELATIVRRTEDTAFHDLAKDALFEAYQQHRGLTAEDWQFFDAFVVVRALSYLGWFHQRPELVRAKRAQHFISKACDHCDTYLRQYR